MNIISVLKKKYNFLRIQWLIATVITISILYLTSSELWEVGIFENLPYMTDSWFILYVCIFTSISFLIYCFDYASEIKNTSSLLLISFISLVFDLFILILSEIFILYTIGVLPKYISSIHKIVLIGAYPSIIGVVTLSSISSKLFDARIRKIENEIILLKNKIIGIEDNWKNRMEDYYKFSKKLDDTIKKIREDEVNEQ